MKNGSKIEFVLYQKDDFNELKEMVFSLYREDAYVEMITLKRLKKDHLRIFHQPEKRQHCYF